MSLKIELIILATGFLLGLFGTVITDWIKNFIQRKEIKRGIVAELKETKDRLVMNAISIGMNLGACDRESLLWMRRHAGDYSKLHSNADTLKVLNALIKEPDENINKMIQAISNYRTQKDGSGMSFKKVALPFLDSKIALVSLFEPQIQSIILEIRTQIHFLNEEIDESRNWLRMTFDSNIGDENYARVDNNHKNSCINIGRFARKAVDYIEALVVKLE